MPPLPHARADASAHQWVNQWSHDSKFPPDNRPWMRREMTFEYCDPEDKTPWDINGKTYNCYGARLWGQAAGRRRVAGVCVGGDGLLAHKSLTHFARSRQYMASFAGSMYA